MSQARYLFRFRPSQLAAAVVLATGLPVAHAQTGGALELETLDVIATAQEELKQAPGVSIINAEDIARQPPANDIAELLNTSDELFVARTQVLDKQL